MTHLRSFCCFLPLALIASAQSPAPQVFGYRDFTQQAKWDTSFLAVPDAKLAGEHLKTLTAAPHWASSPEDYKTAQYVAEKFKAAGLQTEIVPYRVLLNKPIKIVIEAFDASGGKLMSGPTPEHVDNNDGGDPFQDDPRVLPAFNGSSPSGDVTAQVVYANYGTLADFQQLAKLGISVKDKIVLVRYGDNFRGVKVYIAQQYGAKGVLIYSDPADDGYFQRRRLPQGPLASRLRRPARLRAVPPHLSRRPHHPRHRLHARPARLQTHPRRQAPVQPAQHPRQPALLQGCRPHPASPRRRRVPPRLAGRTSLHLPPRRQREELDCQSHRPHASRAGHAPAHHLGRHRHNSRHQPNAEDDWVVAGNHRDAWVYGAVDPNSGTAAMLEAVHGLGDLLKQGWQPERTIVIGSWDAEEEGLMGSTEWAEQHAEDLAHAVAYFNTDVAVSGPDFNASAVPSLQAVHPRGHQRGPQPQGRHRLRPVEGRPGSQLPAPRHARRRQRPDHRPDVRIGDLGSGSDYTPFIQHLGVPSTDIGSDGPYGVYHSVFDNYNWFIKFADPTFVYSSSRPASSASRSCTWPTPTSCPTTTSSTAKRSSATSTAAQHAPPNSKLHARLHHRPRRRQTLRRRRHRHPRRPDSPHPPTPPPSTTPSAPPKRRCSTQKACPSAPGIATPSTLPASSPATPQSSSPASTKPSKPPIPPAPSHNWRHLPKPSTAPPPSWRPQQNNLDITSTWFCAGRRPSRTFGDSLPVSGSCRD